MSTPATEGRSEGDLADALMSAVNRATRGRVHLDGEEADMVLRLLGPSPSAGTAEQRFMVRGSDGPCADGPTEWFVLALDEDDQEVWPPVAACPDELSARRVAAALAAPRGAGK